jgi:hypothetical protein
LLADAATAHAARRGATVSVVMTAGLTIARDLPCGRTRPLPRS